MDIGYDKCSNPELLRRLRNKLGLIGGDINPFLLQKLVTLTIDADKLLRTTIGATNTISISAIGSYIFFTVPKGKKWSVLFIGTVKQGAGAYNYNMAVKIGSVEVPLLERVSGGTLVTYEGNPLELSEGDRIFSNTNSWTTISTQRMDILYIEEELGNVTQ